MERTVIRWARRVAVALLRFEFYGLAFGLVPVGFLLEFLGFWDGWRFVLLGMALVAPAPWCYKVAEETR